MPRAASAAPVRAAIRICRLRIWLSIVPVLSLWSETRCLEPRPRCCDVGVTGGSQTAPSTLPRRCYGPLEGRRSMEFRLLGPLEGLKDDRGLAVRGANQGALLAIFVLHANEVVSRDRLIDDLWGERPPGSPDHSLDHQVSRLRKTLELAELLCTRSGGYVLQVDPDQIDVSRFEHLLQQGRVENAAGRPA